jgi:uncharacterized surface protein with fasciclin (FAS1) repeats
MKRVAFASFIGLALLLASAPAYAVWPFDGGFSSEVESQPLEEKTPAPAAPQPQTAVPVPSTPPVSKPKVTPPAKPVAPKAAAPKVEKPKTVTPTTPPAVPSPKVETPKAVPPAAEVKPATPAAAAPKAETPPSAKTEAPKAAAPIPAAPVKVETPKTEPPKAEPPKAEAPKAMPAPIMNSGPPKVDMTKPPENAKAAVTKEAPAKAAAPVEKKEKIKTREEALKPVQIISTTKPDEKTAPDQQKKEAGTIAGYLQSKPEFTTLVSLLQASGYLAMLKNPGNYTIFAPTDTAFRSLAHPGMDDLKKPENVDLLKSVVSYHLLNGNFLLKSAEGKKAAPNMLQGEVLEIIGKKAGPATITATESSASNGMIYVIDTVLVPPSLVKK